MIDQRSQNERDRQQSSVSEVVVLYNRFFKSKKADTFTFGRKTFIELFCLQLTELEFCVRFIFIVDNLLIL